MDYTKAFGFENFGAYQIIRAIGSIGEHARVLPMTCAVTMIGMICALIAEYTLDQKEAAAGMEILLGITFFFSQYSVAQTMSDAKAAFAELADRITSICSECRNLDAETAGHVKNVLFMYSRSHDNSFFLERGMTSKEAIIKSKLPEVRKIVGIIDLIETSRTKNTIVSTIEDLMTIMIVTFSIPLSISLHLTMGHAYIIPLLVVIFVTFGSFDTAIAGLNPLNRRFKKRIKIIDNIIISIVGDIDN